MKRKEKKKQKFLPNRMVVSPRQCGMDVAMRSKYQKFISFLSFLFALFFPSCFYERDGQNVSGGVGVLRQVETTLMYLLSP